MTTLINVPARIRKLPAAKTNAVRTTVRLQLSIVAVRRLMEQNLLYANDFQCLDSISKDVIKKLYATVCAAKLRR